VVHQIVMEPHTQEHRLTVVDKLIEKVLHSIVCVTRVGGIMRTQDACKVQDKV